MPTKRVIPKFKTEAEEVEWWEKNRTQVTKNIVEAGKRGELKVLTRERLAERLATRPVTIRLPEADLELARGQAQRKGLPYQTYIRSLLHETLAEREAANSSNSSRKYKTALHEGGT
jgi:predicted DNA binding CopG/RHH family protein